ncbi:hypothetical protein F511_37635 [Dorcoceras hygrometricum]|uniref:Uncharacterized protein n=1 Tax=Dorcoceras hygrometricum TaxID=472368 RepID=A0A2Z7C391_9LAMI|nr:hypothetical protein F511_37635 [Dorcoceras hygrometricum]
MVKWQHRGVRDLEVGSGEPHRRIEHAASLGLLGLNGVDDDPADFMPTRGEDLRASAAAVPRNHSDNRYSPIEPAKPVQLDRTTPPSPTHPCMPHPPTRDSQPLPPPILYATATMAEAPLVGPPPGPAGPNLIDLSSNRGRMEEIESSELGAPAMPRDAHPRPPRHNLVQPII